MVQVYIHHRSGRASRPVSELKCFERASLAAGEKKKIPFTLRNHQFSYWSNQAEGLGPGRWDVRPVGRFGFSGVAAHDIPGCPIIKMHRPIDPPCCRATEIPFVFEQPSARYGKELTRADKAMAEAANACWVNFARTAIPRVRGGLPEWPAYSADGNVISISLWKGPPGLIERSASPGKQQSRTA
jgi:hypothetical protein